MAESALELQIRELKDTILQLNETVRLLTKQLQESAAREAVQKEQIEYLTNKLFGRSSEKSSKIADGQLSLFDEAEQEADPEEPEPALETKVREHTRKAKQTYREKLCGIPVEEVVIGIPEEDRICPECGSRMEPIGNCFIRNELQYIPAQVKLFRYMGTHCSCPECRKRGETTILKPEISPALMNHSLASPSSVAWTMYQKYANGLPLYRQEKDWKQYGVELSRTTLANWIIQCGKQYFEPVYDYFHRKLLERKFVMADETRVQVLKEPGRTAEAQSFMWLFRSGEDEEHPIILYKYAPTRSGMVPEEFLKGFSGYLECDGYGGYNHLPDIRRCACYAHIRRYFADAIPKGSEKDLSDPAVQGVKYCSELFECERRAKELSFEQRKEYRLKHAKPVIDAFAGWLGKQAPAAGSRLDKAVKYTLRQEKYLYTYLEDGRCSLSNNLSENSIRPFTVGRKNWLFSDSVKGAEASSIVYTMVEMAKANNVSVFHYLNYLLYCRPALGMTDEEYESLAPWSPEAKAFCSSSH